MQYVAKKIVILEPNFFDISRIVPKRKQGIIIHVTYNQSRNKQVTIALLPKHN